MFWQNNFVTPKSAKCCHSMSFHCFQCGRSLKNSSKGNVCVCVCVLCAQTASWISRPTLAVTPLKKYSRCEAQISCGGRGYCCFKSFSAFLRSSHNYTIYTHQSSRSTKNANTWHMPTTLLPRHGLQCVCNDLAPYTALQSIRNNHCCIECCGGSGACLWRCAGDRKAWDVKGPKSWGNIASPLHMANIGNSCNLSFRTFWRNLFLTRDL